MAGQSIHITVGMKGTIIATAPFDTVIDSRQIHECIGVETINGLIAKGSEPFEDIYEKYDISESQFNADADAGVRIITFQSSIGEIITIPELYIESIPDANGVPYRCAMLGIALSAIPDDFDLTELKTEVSDLIFDYIGVRSEIKEVVFGEPSVLTRVEHIAVEAARVANVRDNESSRSIARRLQDTVNAQAAKIAMLEQYIKDKLPPV